MMKLKQVIFGALGIGFGMLMVANQPADAAKRVKVVYNVKITSVNVDSRNVAITGKNKIYNKAGILKNAKAVTSAKELKKLKNSNRSKDFFNVYRMAVTNKNQVYYKLVSFEGKWRGWIYGGRTKASYNGGIKDVQTTQDIALSQDIKDAKFKLNNPGIAGADNTWTDIPWTKYHAAINTKDSNPYADDELQVVDAKKVTRQYYNTFYYVVDQAHPEFNGWINQNSLTKVTPPAPDNNNDSNNVQVVTNTVTNTITKTVTVPAKNELTINYIVHNSYKQTDPAISDALIKAYQQQYANALSEIMKDPSNASSKVSELGSHNTITVQNPAAYADIYASFDQAKNVINIDLSYGTAIPVIYGPKEILLKPYWEKFDPLSYVTAEGPSGQDLTNQITYQTNVVTGTPGIYYVKYSVPWMGLATTLTVKVTVTSK